jgi:hypothetical protein
MVQVIGERQLKNLWKLRKLRLPFLLVEPLRNSNKLCALELFRVKFVHVSE